MTFEPHTLSQEEQKAMVCVCILAAFADGAQAEAERAQIDRIVKGFPGEEADLISAYQEVLGGRLTLAQVAAQLQAPAAKALAHEMAVCVCNVDGSLTEPETKFLGDLRQALQLEAGHASALEKSAQIVAEQPVAAPLPPVVDSGREADLDRMILNAAILNGALEIMPQTLATMAIIPLQMRLVYQVGKRSGYELDRGHIKDFLATVGVGLSSQVLEGFTSRLIGGLARGVAGRFIGGVVGQAASSAFAFATTYALGQVAKRYYAGGRTLTTAQLKEVFSSMLSEARGLQGRYSNDILQKSRQVNLSELVPLVGKT
jgi:uncharacterized protein (DUF697 family)/tellurite resistance protein